MAEQDYSDSSSSSDDEEMQQQRHDQLHDNLKSILKTKTLGDEKKQTKPKVTRKEVKFIGSEENDALTMADFLKSIEGKDVADIDKEALAAAGISSAALKKQLKKLTKGSPALQKPLSAVKQQRLERTVNYDKNKKETAKWIPQIKLYNPKNSGQVDYTKEANRTKGATIASMAANFEAKDSTEKAIEEALIKDGLATDKQIMEKEKQDLWKLEPKEMQQRLKQMSKLKFLLFRQEIKNKRVKKIKSKLYHKIKRRAREKEEQKLISELEEVDPEAAKEYQEKMEQKRLEERISLRHGTHSKFATNLKRYGKFEDEDTKKAYFELIRQRDDLMKKTKQVTNPNDESDSDFDSDEIIEDVDKLKADALAKIAKEASSDESEGESDSSEEGFDEEKLKSKNKPKSKKTGIMGLKFMQKAEKSQKEVLKQKSKMLIDEIKNYEDEPSQNSDSDQDAQEQSDDQELDEIELEQSEGEGEENEQAQSSDIKMTTETPNTGGKKKFKGEMPDTALPANLTLATEDVKDISAVINKKKSSKSTTKPQKGPKDHIDKVLEDSQNVTSEDLVKQWQGSVNKVSGKKRQNNGLTFDYQNDLKEFKQLDEIKNSRKRIKMDEIDKEDPDLRKIYVTNEDLEKQEFEKQKMDLINDQMDKEINKEDKTKPNNMEGWGSWAGEGITKSRAQIEKEQKRREKKIEEIRKKRLDGKKANVIINESRDRNFTKYMVDKLPHPFKNAGQFEQLMKTPLGKEWNTLSSYKKLIQPELLVKAGKIIKPLAYRKDLTLSTVEKLIEKRKTTEQPAAKF